MNARFMPAELVKVYITCGERHQSGRAVAVERHFNDTLGIGRQGMQMLDQFADGHARYLSQ